MDGVYHWDFYNDQTDVVLAKNNYWGATDNETIDDSIYDDDEGVGEVVFYPFAADPLVYERIPELLGDVNYDGELSVTDVTLVLQMVAGDINTDPMADVNSDGIFTSLDALILIQTVTDGVGSSSAAS